MADPMLMNAAMGGGIFAIIAALGMIALFIFLALYVYFALALMAIAKKTKTENAWLAWIPIANIFLMVIIAEKEWWYALIILLLPLIPVLGGLASMGVAIYIWWLISEKLGKPGWWSILLLIPIVNLVIVGMLAWGE